MEVRLSRARTGIKKALGSGRASLLFAGNAGPFRVRRVPDSPCHVACPAGVNVKAYVGLIAAGEFDRALEVVRARNPLPGICGRVCTHPCESECRRRNVDAPVAVRPLKRFIADHALKSGPARLAPDTPHRPERVAVIGSGPAGLTAANDLARLGYQVAVFEQNPQPGGMLVLGIPPFRLPRDIIAREIESILSLGVRLETRAHITDPAELLSREFAAVFLAPGAHRGLGLGLAGEGEVSGLADGLSFLRQAYSGELRGRLGRVLVVGGGNSAIDSARTAVRLGCREVRIVYRRTRKEMPAAVEEVAEAETEGVKFSFRVQPVELLHSGRRLQGLRCVRNQMGEPDASGRRKPSRIPGSEFDLPADLVVSAVGQEPETRHLAGSRLGLSEAGRVLADQATGRTSLAGVFAGGDVVTGPATVIDAIAAGHRAAAGIHAFLGGQMPGVSRQPAELEVSGLTAVPMERARPRVSASRTRKRFAEVELCLTDTEAVSEAKRCLRCGPCLECVQCHGYCPKHQVALHVPGSDEEVRIRFAGLDAWISDPGADREVAILRPGAGPMSAVAAPVVCSVDQTLCRDCGRCAEVCVHQAIKSLPWHGELKAASVDHLLCRGCGLCQAACPSGALRVGCLHEPALVLRESSR